MSRTYTAFFYGTLLHPAILRRVIGHDGQWLEICPALLLEHTRHQIKFADYPAVLPYTKSRRLFDHELSPEERTVLGTVVKGLVEADIQLLDIFEGNEYTRETVPVHPLGPFTSLTSDSSSSVAPLGVPPPLPPLTSLSLSLEAQTYIWVRRLDELSPNIWEYADFMRDNAHKWVGADAENNKDYAEVDQRRAMSGNTSQKEVTNIVVERE